MINPFQPPTHPLTLGGIIIKNQERLRIIFFRQGGGEGVKRVGSALRDEKSKKNKYKRKNVLLFLLYRCHGIDSFF